MHHPEMYMAVLPVNLPIHRLVSTAKNKTVFIAFFFSWKNHHHRRSHDPENHGQQCLKLKQKWHRFGDEQ